MANEQLSPGAVMQFDDGPRLNPVSRLAKNTRLRGPEKTVGFGRVGVKGR